jgi:hypothetical protein
MTPTWRRCRLLILGASLSLGCSGDGSAGRASGVMVDTLPGGAVHVSNPQTGAWSEGEAWSAVEALRLGTIDYEGPEAFAEPGAIEIDALERIWVLDLQAREIRVFSREGAFVRTVGSPGDGPGQISRPLGLASGPDGTMWVVEPARYTVFDTTGALVTTYQRQRPMTYLLRGDVDREGRVAEPSQMEVEQERRIALLRYDPGGSSADTFLLPLFEQEMVSVEVEQPGGVAIYRGAVPFTPSQVWTIDPRGYVWHGSTGAYRVVQQDWAGDTVRIVERAFEPAPVTPTEREIAYERLGWAEERGMDVTEVQIPDTKAAYESIFLDEQSYLWIVPSISEDEPAELPRISALDVFDPEGLYLGRVELPTKILSVVEPAIRGDMIVGVTLDELQVPYVVVFDIEGRF